MAEAMKDHIAILGAGAWGTALAIQAERAGQRALADRAGARLLLAIVPQPMLRRWRREGQDWLAGTRQRWWPDALAAPAR